MKKQSISILALVLLTAFRAQSQSDSLAVAHTLTTLLKICKNVDFTDPKTQDVGPFYKAAPFIAYRNEADKVRGWKDVTNYANPTEKKMVDQVCLRINNSVNQDSAYRIVKYLSENQSEGTWHVLFVAYIKRGVPKEAAFAFLKIKGKFALGDID